MPVPATRPPGGFPQPPAARLPRASRPLRAADAQDPCADNTEARLQSLRLLTPILCEHQAAKPRPDKSQARPSYVGPGPQSSSFAKGYGGQVRRLTRRASAAKRKKNGATGSLLFRSTRRDFTYAVQGLLAPASLRSTLSRCGVISLGSSKKYSGEVTRLCRWHLPSCRESWIACCGAGFPAFRLVAQDARQGLASLARRCERPANQLPSIQELRPASE